MTVRGTVLVTGADGFIGSHLVERLLDQAATVRALCCYNSAGSFGWLDDLATARRDAVDIRLGDVRDAGFVRAAVAGCEVVYHLAALVSIPYSYAAPAAFVETNVTGTLNILEACRHTGVARLVHTSTSEVYGTPSTLPITEAHPLQSQSPYAATKIGADMLAYAWAKSFEVPVVVLRPFNTYGPRQSARAVIPVILGQLLAGAEVLRIGSLEPRRDFTYVTDTVEGFLASGTRTLQPGTTVQLGTGRSVPVADLIELAMKAVGRRVPVLIDEQRVRPKEGEVMVLESDPSLAREILGWTPSVSLEEGLQRTMEWLRGRIDRNRVVRYEI